MTSPSDGENRWNPQATASSARSHAVAQGRPFFIELAPTGPHDQGLGKVAVPCARHENLYSDVRMPLVRIPADPDPGSSKFQQDLREGLPLDVGLLLHTCPAAF